MENGGKPIFIHSLFRSGSTYLFNVFRRSDAGYWCYQEPLHEVLGCIDTTPETLLAFHGEPMRHLRHPELARPYFYEFHEIREHLAGTFRKEFSYDYFFINDALRFPTDLAEYIRRLIDFAKGRAVLQFCRSAGRVRPLRQLFDAVHLHLWRNPRDQWWSYKTTDYFDAATQLIYNARELPPVLQEAKNRAAVADLHRATVAEELSVAQDNRLSSVGSYLAFYALWLYAFLECEEAADISISIDQLSQSEAYRQRTLEELVRAGVGGLDFSDCSVPQTVYDERDIRFFQRIEEQVIGLFLLSGYSKESIEMAGHAMGRATGEVRAEPATLIETASRSREIALRYATALAETQHRTVTQALEQARLTAELTGKNDELAHTGMRLATLEGELGEAHHQCDSLALEVTRTKEQATTLEHELAQMRQLKETLQDNLEVTRQRSAQVKAELAQSTERVKELEGELAETRQLGVALQERLATVQHDAARTEDRLTQSTERVARLEPELAALRHNEGELQSKLNFARESATQAEGELSKTRTRLSALEEELQQLRAQSGSLQESLTHATSTSHYLALAMAEEQERKSQLRRRLDETLEQLTTAEGNTSKATGEVLLLQERVRELISQLATAQEHLAKEQRQLVATLNELTMVYKSRSWRITTPLRRAKYMVHAQKSICRRFISHAVATVLTRPALYHRIRPIVVRCPPLWQWLRSFMPANNTGDETDSRPLSSATKRAFLGAEHSHCIAWECLLTDESRSK